MITPVLIFYAPIKSDKLVFVNKRRLLSSNERLKFEFFESAAHGLVRRIWDGFFLIFRIIRQLDLVPSGAKSTDRSELVRPDHLEQLCIVPLGRFTRKIKPVFFQETLVLFVVSENWEDALLGNLADVSNSVVRIDYKIVYCDNLDSNIVRNRFFANFIEKKLNKN